MPAGRMLPRLVLGALAGMAWSAVAAAGPTEVAESIWAMVVLGMPLGVLMASMLASALRDMREPAQPDQDIPKRVARIVFDGIVGGYLAMLVVGLSFTREYVADVLPAVLGALFAIVLPWWRANWRDYVDPAFRAVLSLLPGLRKRSAQDDNAGGGS